MAVVAGGTARAAQIADELALLDGLARADGQGQAVWMNRGTVCFPMSEPEGNGLL